MNAFGESQSRETQQLYVEAALDDRLKPMVSTIQNELIKNKAKIMASTGLSEEDWLTMNTGLKEAYSQQAFKDSVLRAMDSALSKADIENILVEYRKEHLRQLVQAEKFAGTKAGVAKINECSASGYSLNVNPTRKGLLEAISDVSGKTEQSFMAIREVIILGNQIMNLSVSEKKRMIRSDIVETVDSDSNIRNVRILLQHTSFPSLACSYQDIDNAELENSIAFMKSPAGLQFDEAVVNGLRQALTNAGLAFDNTVSEILSR